MTRVSGGRSRWGNAVVGSVVFYVFLDESSLFRASGESVFRVLVFRYKTSRLRVSWSSRWGSGRTPRIYGGGLTYSVINLAGLPLKHSVVVHTQKHTQFICVFASVDPRHTVRQTAQVTIQRRDGKPGLALLQKMHSRVMVEHSTTILKMRTSGKLGWASERGLAGDYTRGLPLSRQRTQ